MRSFNLFVAVTALAMGACAGGEIHFVKEKPKAETPELSPQTESVKESFTYGRPNGLPYIVFMVHPRKSMRDLPLKMDAVLDEFNDELWLNSEGYDGMVFSVNRDVYPVTSSEVRRFPIEAGRQETMLESLRADFSTLETDRGQYELLSISPFLAFSDAITYNGVVTDLDSGVWVHTIYLRDDDLTTTGESRIAALKEGEQMYGQALASDPYSSYRQTIHSLTYQSEETECDPLENHVGMDFTSYMQGKGSKVYELCDLLGSDMQKGVDLMRGIAQSIHSAHSRLVLRERPFLESLSVEIDGVKIDRSSVFVDAATNELSFDPDVNEEIVYGSIIEVTYQPLRSDS